MFKNRGLCFLGLMISLNALAETKVNLDAKKCWNPKCLHLSNFNDRKICVIKCFVKAEKNNVTSASNTSTNSAKSSSNNTASAASASSDTASSDTASS